MVFYYRDRDVSFSEVKAKWDKVCREFSDGALLETAKENIDMGSPVYLACQDEMNRRQELGYRKLMRDEVRPFIKKRKRELRRKFSLQNKHLEW